jgi:hypothetical protein
MNTFVISTVARNLRVPHPNVDVTAEIFGSALTKHTENDRGCLFRR